MESENRRLRDELEQAQRRTERLERDKQNLNESIERLRKELEAAGRKSQRAAAPFSRGKPKTNPKTPGRKSGSRYGRHHHRARPAQVDEQIEVDLPSQCPDCGGPVELQRVESQYPEEIVRRTFRVQGCHADAEAPRRPVPGPW